MLSFFPEKTKVIFFDLEFYVPEQHRYRDTPSGMIYSPLLSDCQILGGVFQTYYPLLDKLEKPVEVWQWKFGSEKDVLQKIFDILQKEWKSQKSKGDKRFPSLMLCGIGISKSDIPALLMRMIANKIDNPTRIYDLICGCQQIDLSVATYCQFSFNHKYFSYPKNKSQLYQKYLEGKKMESGKSVWDLYDNSDFLAIENRTLEEISDCVNIYKSMFETKIKTDNEYKWLKRNMAKLNSEEQF